MTTENVVFIKFSVVQVFATDNIPNEGNTEAVAMRLTGFLPEDLMLQLNPIVVRPLKACNLPDAPATKELLESKFEQISLKCNIPKQVCTKTPIFDVHNLIILTLFGSLKNHQYSFHLTLSTECPQALKM